MKIVNMPNHGVVYQKNLSYFTGLRLLTVVMTALTLLYVIASIESNDFVILANIFLPIVLFFILFSVMLWRIKKEKIFFWCPLTWFFFGAAIAFGYGSSAWYFADKNTIDDLRTLYAATDRQILGTNLLNSASILFILFGYWIGIRWFSRSKFIVPTDETNTDTNISNIKRFIKRLIPIYIPFVFFVHLPTIYGLSNVTVPGVLNNISKLGDVIILLMFFLWGKGIKRYAFYGIFMCIMVFFAAIPSFGKVTMLAPFFAATLGYFWATTNIKVLFYGAALILFMLATIVSPISVIGRASTFGIDGEKVSAAMVSDVLITFVKSNSNSTANTSDEKDHDAFWKRNSFNNVQSYLMEAYDNGYSGTTLNAFFIAIIPRIIWPDKPIITHVGLDLDALVKGWVESKSQLAPTFNGEAYWNGGWGMVGLVCTIIGIQFAQFAVYAQKYLSKGDVRYFIISLMGIQYGLTVESWVIPKYVGGYLTILCLWFIIKWLVPWKEGTTLKKSTK